MRETIGNMSYWPFPPLGGAEFAQRLEHLLEIYPWPITLTQLNLLDSHDTSRLITIAGGDVASVRLATLLLLTLPGAPSIYYGDEIGLTGGRPDAMARKAFPWSHPETWNRDLLRFYKEAIALRTAHRALRTGAYRRLAADSGALAFARVEERSDAPAVLVVAVNASDEERAIDCAFGEMPVREASPTILFGDPRVAEHGRMGSRLILPARSGAVLDLSPSR